MARIDDDAVWVAVPTGELVYDDYEDELVEVYDYVLDGSVALSPFEAMVYRSAAVAYQPRIEV